MKSTAQLVQRSWDQCLAVWHCQRGQQLQKKMSETFFIKTNLCQSIMPEVLDMGI